jgi:hypothetical protein
MMNVDDQWRRLIIITLPILPSPSNQTVGASVHTVMVVLLFALKLFWSGTEIHMILGFPTFSGSFRFDELGLNWSLSNYNTTNHPSNLFSFDM